MKNSPFVPQVIEITKPNETNYLTSASCMYRNININYWYKILLIK